MKLELDDTLQQMLVNAVRYALGRHTYIVGLTAGYVGYLLKDMSDNTLHVLKRDIDTFLNEISSSEWDCDAKLWAVLLKETERVLDERKEVSE